MLPTTTRQDGTIHLIGRQHGTRVFIAKRVTRGGPHQLPNDNDNDKDKGKAKAKLLNLNLNQLSLTLQSDFLELVSIPGIN